MKKYSIGEASKITGLPAKTLRFYEEKGVVSAAKRAENGYRYFVDSDLDEIKLVKNARDLGLPMAEIKKLVVGCENGDCEHTKDYIKKTIDKYLKLLSERTKQMEELKLRLGKLQKNGPYCCGILHQLSIANRK